MKTALAVLFVASLLLVTLAAAPAATTAGDSLDAPATAPATASAALAGGEALPLPPAVGAKTAVAPAAPAPPAASPAEWLYACVPQCSYYYGICQEECSGLGGIKSFYCTPPPPGICAHFTCVCNKGL